MVGGKSNGNMLAVQFQLKEIIYIMRKFTVLVFLILAVTHLKASCPSHNIIKQLEANSLTFKSSPQRTGIIEEEYSHNSLQIFSKEPQVCLGITDINVDKMELGAFFVKIKSASTFEIKFLFSHNSAIWKSIRIVFFSSARDDIYLGSVYTNFNSLKGQQALSRVRFKTSIPNHDTSIMRAFLNGYSTNRSANPNQVLQIQISLGGETVKEKQTLVSVMTGPNFDLKEIWYSFVIFSPWKIPFASYGRTYQEVHFSKTNFYDLNSLIYRSQYRFLGLSLLSVLKSKQKLTLSTDLDTNFVLKIATEDFIDKINVVIVVFGISSDESCRNCEDKYIFVNECVSKCPNGSYPIKFDEGGIGCRQCLRELNQEINSEFTGCTCISGAVKKSGKCVFETPPKQTKPAFQNLNNQFALPISQADATLCPMKNSYWTGFRCSCSTGYIPLATGCESIEKYIDSLKYSNSLYPAQFQYTPTFNKILESPCRMDELRFNGTCICKDGFYKNFKNQCIQCQQNSIYNEKTSSCQCRKGYKLNERTNECIVDCPFTQVLNNDGTCVCPTGLALSYSSICIPCNSSRSYIQKGYCFFCPGDLSYNFNTKKCGCKSNEIQTIANECVGCDALETAHNNVCECFAPYSRDSVTKRCVRKCSILQISIFGACIDCPLFSYNSGNNKCTCFVGYHLINSRCELIPKSCPKGLFFDVSTNQCNLCPEKCDECDHARECRTCQDGYDLRSGQCVPLCGNGILNYNEECDDGNNFSNDGCSSSCFQERGYQCYGRPTFCLSVCGNGIITRYEKCDDGNRINGDGCSNQCSQEPGFVCRGQPSICYGFNFGK